MRLLLTAGGIAPLLASTTATFLPPTSSPTTAFIRPSLPRIVRTVPPQPAVSMSAAGSSADSAAASARPACPAQPSRDLDLFLRTPLLLSAPLTNLLSRPVYLKLDSLQGSGSFKDRGMAHLCHTFRQRGVSKLISSSGGNAGLAVATVAPRLGMSVSVVVPQTTKTMVVDKLRRLGAEVTVHGSNWNEADVLARRRVEEDDAAEYVSPYDHPLLWTGHSTVVDEVVEQLADLASKEQGSSGGGGGGELGTIIASVGGGGLICGILEGLERRDLSRAAVIAAETEGAASFGKAWNSGERVRLDGIDSVATSLGALEVTPVALERAAAHRDGGGTVRSAVCTDAEAVEACVRFAEDHRVLVEPACGAALAVVYSDRLRVEALADLPAGPVVVEVCGGSGVNLDLLDAWKKEFLS